MKKSKKDIFYFLAICLFSFLLVADKLFSSNAIDFPSFYLAAKSLNLGLNIYEFDDLWQKEGFNNYVYPYVYTPILAQILSFFEKYFSFDQLLVFWRILSVLLFSFSILNLKKYFGSFKIELNIIIILFAILFSAFRYIIIVGQVDLILFSLIIFAFKLQIKSKNILAGLTLSFTILLKIFPLFLLPLVFIKNKKFGYYSILFSILIFTFSVLIFGSETWAAFLENSIRSSNNPESAAIASIYDINNSSLLPTLDLFVNNINNSILVQRVIFLFTLVLSLAVVRKNKDINLIDLQIFMILMILWLPFLWLQHFIYLFPLMLILLFELSKKVSLSNLIILIILILISINSINIMGKIGVNLPEVVLANYKLVGFIIILIYLIINYQKLSFSFK